jgi:phage tail-like protein
VAKTGDRRDPNSQSRFHVEIDGIDQASFRNVGGLQSTTAVEEYQEGGLNEEVHKLIGQTTYSTITLTQGFTADPALFKWRAKFAEHDDLPVNRKGVSTIQYDHDNKTEVGRWNFEGAWPASWEVGELDGASGQAQIETLVLYSVLAKPVRRTVSVN